MVAKREADEARARKKADAEARCIHTCPRLLPTNQTSRYAWIAGATALS